MNKENKIINEIEKDEEKTLKKNFKKILFYELVALFNYYPINFITF